MSVGGLSRLGIVGALCAYGAALALLGVPASALAAEAPTVGEQWVTHVTATAATLEAKVNPAEVATTYKFEYATGEAALLAGQGEVFPAPPSAEGEAGAGSEGVVVEEHPQGLRAHTDYWYRVVATNGDGTTLGCEAAGSCESFTTRVAGGELELPDGRAWELVSPVPGSSGDTISAQPLRQQGGAIQAAEDGGAITYLSFSATELEPVGDSNFSQILSVRGEHGWSSRDIATPHKVATGLAPLTQGQEYRFFSTDLSVGLVEPLGSGSGGQGSALAALLSPGASEKTLYVRADAPLLPQAAEQGVYGQAEAEGGYRPLVTGCPSEPAECRPRVKEDANVPPGVVFGETNEQSNLLFQGASTDLSHVVFSSSVPLAKETPEGKAINEGALYEWSGGQLQIVSVLPDGEPAQSESLGNGDYNSRGAVSSDGSRIVWSSNEHLYMRDVSSEPEQTVQLDAFQEGGSGNSNEAYFQFANSDGSRVFFTDEADLVGGSTAHREHPDLYECEMIEEVPGELSCKLSDLTVDPGGHASVVGVVDVGSEEDTDLYFVATGKLTGRENEHKEEAKVGEDNLYLLHYDSESKQWQEPVFIAALSENDSPDFVQEGGGSFEDLENKTSRVSPNGEYLTFMSERSLTGYDNRDASSGEADEEVFLYDVRSNRLVCVSCNPTGERPVGMFTSPQAREANGGTLLIDSQENWGNRWLAASLPGWTGMEQAVARYQSRYLSNEGRLFFDSPDELVPQATNGSTDVYEYDPVGVGGCEASSVTFSERSDGCVGLISSGSSSGESAFLDASGKGPGGHEGEDVFFLSSAQLVPADTGSGLAVYDAHMCGAAAPCSTEAVSSPPCTTEASCKPAPAPQPAIFGSGPSETFSGAGNPIPPQLAAVKVKTVPAVKAEQLAKALQACKKDKSKKKRARCGKRAQSQYGSAKKAKKSTHHKGGN